MKYALPSLCLFVSLAWAADDEPKPRLDVVKKNVAAVKQAINDDYEHLDALYKHIHANPELSLKELKTAARLAKELRDAGYTVTEKVGGTGVVGILKNGDGPTVMIRADMDALPVIEKTGVPYASKVMVRNDDGQEVGVMHACGHDINVTCLVGVARLLAKRKDTWQGTLMLVGQPAEELGLGAKQMLADGLFERFPKPDLCFGLHCDGRYPHGHVNYREGQMQANVDEVDILVKGKGGHGAAPHAAIDPVVIAARIVIDLQTISSREMNPADPVVVTVGSIHGGTKHNIIPNDVKLQLTVRTSSDPSRKKVLDAIARIAKGAAMVAGAPEPLVELRPHFTPALINNTPLARRTVPVFKEVLGADKVHERGISMGGEDFSRYIRAGVPGFYFFLGTAPPERVAEAKQGGKPLPSVHSDAYYPIPEPTIKTGMLAMTSAVLNVLGK
ncbi:MAG: amidohydrolase [Gemmataceae bacterium]